ncbi:hypothetical protein ACFLRT_05060 [Acidobacteriota bacterium]
MLKLSAEFPGTTGLPPIVNMKTRMIDIIDDIIFPFSLSTAFILPDQAPKVNKELDLLIYHL